ncbi:putative metal-binding motif-containing protein [Corallococcus sp. EGB]|uniref:putative metal-binding motif-containing protein n=1 Tax=Corallococcus sp. EGB TaxID=1521117 RepID=UPI001CBB2027|nr:putative metal-binding motif-containing protein [Corallococcus sp. EGB]
MSRFRLLWVALLGLSLVRCTVPSLEDLWREKEFCAAGDEDCGMLHIRVDAQGFVPGCLKFEAKEPGGTATRMATVPYRGTARAGTTLTQGFSPPKGWGLTVTVSVAAFEQGCDGQAVTAQDHVSTLREGTVATMDFTLVASDADADGYVSVLTGGTDCDDSNAAVHPGAAEVCNGADDNCNGETDEGFSVGNRCFDGSTQCDGAYQCTASGTGVQCQPSGPVPIWYPDEDQDTYGALDGGIASCVAPAGAFAREGGDCDDGNPFIHPNAPELCDEQDNNCNAMIDEAGACLAGSPTWAGQTVLDGGADFLAVSVYGDGGVWAVGVDLVRVVKTPESTELVSLPKRCTSGPFPLNLYSVWAHPQTGMAFIGIEDGVLMVQTPASMACTPRTAVNPSSITTSGLQGFVADGGVEIYGVGRDSAKVSGATFIWDGGTAAVTASPVEETRLRAVHGISPEVMFAVGEPASSAIYRYDPALATWTFNGSAPSGVSLNAVHVVNPRLAYAVGSGGTVLQWNGTWSSLPGLSSTRENLTGVLAFGTHSIYVTSEGGRVFRFNGTSWSPVYSGAAIHGIAGTRPDDIWVVGRFGQVAHYPGWPQ